MSQLNIHVTADPEILEAIRGLTQAIKRLPIGQTPAPAQPTPPIPTPTPAPEVKPTSTPAPVAGPHARLCMGIWAPDSVPA